MLFDNPSDKLVCVFGLGQSGLSTARYLQRINVKFFVVDTRENPPGVESVKALSCCTCTHFSEIPQNKINNASMIILSPGVSPRISPIVEAQNNAVSVIGDIEVFVNQTKSKIVAITGSNGKSTVTDLTHKLLCSAGVKARIGGNFGMPVLDYLPEDDAEVYVLELSSFQLDTTKSLQAEVAVVLNITEDHMDRYVNFEEYIESKVSIFSGAKCSIANADDRLTCPEYSQSIKHFSLIDCSSQYHVSFDKHLVIDGKKIVGCNELHLTGKHNWSNALVSLAILNEIGIELSAPVLTTLKKYSGLAHRFQLVAKNKYVEWVNDSKATNVGATQAALTSIDRKEYSEIVLIAGGDAKDGNLAGLKNRLNEKVSYLVLIGKDAHLFAKLMPEEKIYFASDMSDAVRHASAYIMNKEESKKTALVLLSPACASLDMYRNFEARGQAFVDAIRQMKECA